MFAIFIYLLALSLYSNAAPLESIAKACKIIPQSPEWPSVSDWSILNTTLDGVLLHPDAPAAACHPKHATYNEGKCKELVATWTSSQWHSDNPTSSLWQNWNGYSCMPDAKSSCTTDGFPVYVVNVTRAEHVKLAVNFAREKNIRLNIKSTGHDFLGRSVQPKSLSIWTHYLRDIQYHDGYKPHGCDFIIPGAAVGAGSGTQMRELYRFAADRNVMIVGGSSSTVSVGGYLQFGGHSVLSAAYGMGADNVIEIEAVLANGEIVVANECQNEDLFWAMRGGGGSTFGVVLKYVIHAFPSVPVASWSGYIFGNQSVEANWDAVTYIHQQWPTRISAIGGTGYMIGTPGLLSTNKSSPSLSMTLPNPKTPKALEEALQPIIDGVYNLTGGKVSLRGKFGYAKSWTDTIARNNTKDDSKGFPGAGASKLITSWLWDEQAVNRPNLKEALMAASDNQTLLYNDFTAGPGTHNPPFIRGGGNAVNPAWRTAFVRPAAEMQWAGVDLEKLEERKIALKAMHRAMKIQAPHMGSYGNEADAFDQEATHNFFGANYPRLLSIKNKVDPTGVFYCVNCVGSDGWQDMNGQLCPRT